MFYFILSHIFTFGFKAAALFTFCFILFDIWIISALHEMFFSHFTKTLTKNTSLCMAFN